MVPSHAPDYRKSFWISMVVIFLTQAYLAVFLLYPSVLRIKGFSLGISGLLMGAFNFFSTLGRPLGARATERIGVRKTLLWTSGFVALFSLPLAFTKNPWLLLALRGTCGAFWGISMVAISSYQGLSIPADKRGSAYAWVAVAYVFPQIILFPLVDWFVSSNMLIAYFLAAAAVEAAIVIVAFPLPPLAPAVSTAEVKEWGNWRELPAVPCFRVGLSTMFLFAFVNASTLQYLPTLLSMKGFPASIFIVPNALTAVFLRVVSYRVMDKLNRKMLIGPVLAAMGLVLAFLPFAPGKGWYVAGGIIYGVNMGMCFPIILALMPDIFPDHLRPKGISLCFFAIDLGFIFSPFFLGYGGQIIGLGNILTVTGILGLIGGTFLFFAWRREA